MTKIKVFEPGTMTGRFNRWEVVSSDRPPTWCPSQKRVVAQIHVKCPECGKKNYLTQLKINSNFSCGCATARYLKRPNRVKKEDVMTRQEIAARSRARQKDRKEEAALRRRADDLERTAQRLEKKVVWRDFVLEANVAFQVDYRYAERVAMEFYRLQNSQAGNLSPFNN